MYVEGSGDALTYVKVRPMAKTHPRTDSGARAAVFDSILARKLSVSVPLSKKEKAALAAVQSEPQTVAAGEDLLVDGKRSHVAFVFRAGWAVRYKLLPDGRRQILNFVLPGDIVGFREYLFEVTAHSVGALTDLEVSTMNPAALTKLFYEYPKLALALALSASREAAMLEEQVVRIGRRNAYERMAHLFLELLQRLAMVGQASQGTFELPVTQEVLSDALGLSIVHVNRTLRRFRRENLLELAKGRIVLKDRDALIRIADFESRYLHQKKLEDSPGDPLFPGK